jgi:hypothetical protein
LKFVEKVRMQKKLAAKEKKGSFWTSTAVGKRFRPIAFLGEFFELFQRFQTLLRFMMPISKF